MTYRVEEGSCGMCAVRMPCPLASSHPAEGFSKTQYSQSSPSAPRPDLLLAIARADPTTGSSMCRDVLVQERADTSREVARAVYNDAGCAESYVARTIMYEPLPSMYVH